MPPNSYPQPTAVLQHLFQTVETYMMRSYPVRDLPLNIRPGMIFVTGGWLLLLGVLGMAPLPTLPINDKALHFFGLGFATFLLYFIIEVPEGPARRVWYIRRAPLLLTSVTSFFFGGIVSEFVQSTLPWKTFQSGDIVANLLGALIFLYLAHLLHTRSRRRQELSSLYQPLSSATYRDAQGREHAFDTDSNSFPSNHQQARQAPHRAATRGGSGVWEEESDRGGSIDESRQGGAVFGLGDEEEGDDSGARVQVQGKGGNVHDLV